MMNQYGANQVNSGSKLTVDTTFSDRVQRNIKDISTNNANQSHFVISKESHQSPTKQASVAPKTNNYSMNQNWVHRGMHQEAYIVNNEQQDLSMQDTFGLLSQSNANASSCAKMKISPKL